MAQRFPPLLQTKLHRPAPARDVVARTRLLDGLSGAEGGTLTLIAAPAGYGKSTLASQWIESQELPTGWFSVDEGDNEPDTFVRYFVNAIREAVPGACSATLAAISEEDSPDPGEIVQLLINETLQLDRLVLVVLDDFHRIHSPEVLQILVMLLERPLPTLHLVILTRRDPKLPIGTLRAAGRLSEVRMSSLRFTAQEGLSFLAQAFPEGVPTELSKAVESLEGWAVGLRLLLLQVRRTSDRSLAMEHLPAVGSQAREYLLSEVLERLPQERLSSLLRIAITSRFCAPLVEAMCGVEGFDGEDFLQWLSDTGLFLIPLDASGEWFRFHHFFEDVLVKRLEKQIDAAALGELHACASRWFEAQGLVEEAFEHGLKTPGACRAIDLIAIPSDTLFHTQMENFRLVRRLPPGAAESRPGTVVSLAWMANHNEQREEQQSYLKLLEDLLRAGDWDAREESMARVSAYSLRLGCLWNDGDYPAIVALGREALELVAPDRLRDRQIFRLYLAHSLARLGRIGEARQVIQDGFTEVIDSNPKDATMAYSNAALIEATTLNIRSLETAAKRFIAFKKKVGDAEVGWPRFVAAFARYQANNLDAAETVLELEKDEMKVDENGRVFVLRETLRARILFARGEEAKAVEVMEDLRFQMLESSNSRLASYAEAASVEFSLRAGRVTDCQGFYEGFVSEGSLLVNLMPNPCFAFLRAAIAINTGESLAKAGQFLDALFEQLGESPCPLDHTEPLVLRSLWHHANGRETAALEDLGTAVALTAPGRAVRILADFGPPLAPLLQRLKLDEAGVEYVGRVLAILRDNDEHPQPLIENLSKRELEILRLLGRRFSNKDIASELFISVDTVKRHAVNIYGKLGVNRRADAVAKATGLGLLS